MKTTLILNYEYKKLPSAKNILGGFSCFVVIVLLAQHRVNRTSNSAGAVIKLPRHVYSRNSEAPVCQMMPRYRFFVFVSFLFLSSFIKFDKKCANSTQRSQSPNSQRLTIVSGKSKIYSPRQGYLSPGNSIVLVIAATLLFISVTIFCQFWGSFC